MKSISLLASLALAATLFSSCSKKETKQDVLSANEHFPAISTWQAMEPDAAPTIKVINQFNEPVSDAKILIGQTVGSPFKNNFITTDRSGVAVVSTEWETIEHVTTEAPGYIRQTLMSQKPGNLTIKLNPAYLAQKAMVQGQITQLPVTNGDKQIDFGLVMPALARTDMLNFDFGAVLSPYNDILSVASYNIPIPSNVSLPTQKENYIFSMTISKPQFRVYLPTLGPKRVYTTAGRFPFKEVVDEIRGGKPFYEVINYFTLSGGGMRDLTLVNPTTQIDIPGNELSFKSTISATSPKINSDELYLAIAASEVTGMLIPTDIKKLGSTASINLNTMDGNPKYLIGVLKRQNEFMADTPGADRLSVSLLPYSASQKPLVLPLVQNPTVNYDAGYTIQMPQAPTTAGINGIAVAAMISDMNEVPDGNKKVINLTRKWEILGTSWPATLQLPNWPLSSTQVRRRIEVNFIGSTTASNVGLGDNLIKAVTHVSHASADY